MVRAGLAGDDAPRIVFHNVIGRTKYEPVIGSDNRDKRVGDEAMISRGMLRLRGGPLLRPCYKHMFSLSKKAES